MKQLICLVFCAGWLTVQATPIHLNSIGLVRPTPISLPNPSFFSTPMAPWQIVTISPTPVAAGQAVDTLNLSGDNAFVGLPPGRIAQMSSLLDSTRRYHISLRVLSLAKTLFRYSPQARKKTAVQGFLSEHDSAVHMAGIFGNAGLLLPDSINRINDLTQTKKYARLNLRVFNRRLRALDSCRESHVSFIGAANTISSVKSIGGTQLNAGFGVEASRPSVYDFLAVITVAQTNDTIFQNGFSASMLVPGVRKFSLLTSYRQDRIFRYSYSALLNKIGFTLNVNVTPYNWQIKKTTGTVTDTVFAHAIPAAVDVLFPVNWYTSYRHSNNISIATDLGLSFRYVFGDLNDDSRKLFLNNKTPMYAGLYLGFYLRYNNFRAQFSGPVFFGPAVPGLTNGQVYASIGFVTSFVDDLSKIVGKN